MSQYLDAPQEFEHDWPFDALQLFIKDPTFKLLKTNCSHKERLMLDSQDFQRFSLDSGKTTTESGQTSMNGYFE